MSELAALLGQVRAHAGIGLKQDITTVSHGLDALPDGWHPNGDDTAAIPCGDGWQLLAIEGMQGRLLSRTSSRLKAGRGGRCHAHRPV